MHSAIVALELTFGRANVVSSDVGIRKPVEPVSTATLGMVTQLVVFGIQTVTVVYATLA